MILHAQLQIVMFECHLHAHLAIPSPKIFYKKIEEAVTVS